MGNKYIICDYAKANWGKTETLLEVINILDSPSKPQYALIDEKPNTGKDRWCLFGVKDREIKDKQVVISTLGDPYSAQPVWLEDAAKTGANVIVTASRSKGSTVNVVYDIARKYGYEIIWFQNFYFDNATLVGLLPMVDVKSKGAESIVEIIDKLLK